MCGICGIYRFDQAPVDPNIIRRMNDRMRLRGPDGEGVHVQQHFGMGMRRLAIIDVAHGQQPIFNETGTIAVVCNGEIYNYIELRQALEARGHRFRTQSDVEVLVHLYEDQGVEAIHELIGMFAFCLWDGTRQRVWIARDRLGIKPLYYAVDQRQLVFGSTIDAVAACPGVRTTIDDEAFLLYLTLAYVPTPRSICAEIKKLPPGHQLLIEKNRWALQRYWDIPKPAGNGISHGEFLEEIDGLLQHSIALHGRSEVPVACLLSGGIDSSYVTARFSQQHRSAVSTYSVDFEGKAERDLHYAQLVADAYHTDHHPYRIDPHQAFALLQELIGHFDEPMADSAIIPSYYLSQQARQQGIKVLLNGAGGDELFGGYFRHFRHKRDAVIGTCSWIPYPLWGALRRVHPQLFHYGLQLKDRGLSYALATSGVDLFSLRQCLRRPAHFYQALALTGAQFRGLHDDAAAYGFSYGRMLTDVKQYLVDNILSLTDKTTMACSVEGRVPLLDHRLVERIFSLPMDLNLSDNVAKASFKQIAGRMIPEQILTRPKTGFNGPVHQWIEQTHWPAIQARLQRSESPLIQRYIDVGRLSALMAHPRQRTRATESVFLLYVYDVWAEQRRQQGWHCY